MFDLRRRWYLFFLVSFSLSDEDEEERLLACCFLTKTNKVLLIVFESADDLERPSLRSYRFSDSESELPEDEDDEDEEEDEELELLPFLLFFCPASCLGSSSSCSPALPFSGRTGGSRRSGGDGLLDLALEGSSWR